MSDLVDGQILLNGRQDEGSTRAALNSRQAPLAPATKHPGHEFAKAELVVRSDTD